MPQILSSLPGLLASPAITGALDVAQLGSTGYNLYDQYKQQQYQNKLRELRPTQAPLASSLPGIRSLSTPG